MQVGWKFSKKQETENVCTRILKTLVRTGINWYLIIINVVNSLIKRQNIIECARQVPSGTSLRATLTELALTRCTFDLIRCVLTWITKRAPIKFYIYWSSFFWLFYHYHFILVNNAIFCTFREIWHFQ